MLSVQYLIESSPLLEANTVIYSHLSDEETKGFLSG